MAGRPLRRERLARAARNNPSEYWKKQLPIALAEHAKRKGKILGQDAGGDIDLSEASLPEAFLSGAFLSGAELRGVYLRAADLSRADLSNADLSNADLVNANLDGANLDGANLHKADLTGANLGRANLRGANLEGADLEDVSLGRVDLGGANLSEANLAGALFGHATMPDGSTFTGSGKEWLAKQAKKNPKYRPRQSVTKKTQNISGNFFAAAGTISEQVPPLRRARENSGALAIDEVVRMSDPRLKLYQGPFDPLQQGNWSGKPRWSYDGYWWTLSEENVCKHSGGGWEYGNFIYAMLERNPSDVHDFHVLLSPQGVYSGSEESHSFRANDEQSAKAYVEKKLRIVL